MSRFLTPASLPEALDALAQPGAKVLAGGTDLMISLRQARMNGDELPELLVDITRLPELQRLELEGPGCYLGAGLTFRFLDENPDARQRVPVLSQAASMVGSMQVRQTGTIGGNVANGSPAADGMSALVALDAVAEIASREGVRHCPLSELITAPNKTTLTSGELILGYAITPPPAPAGQVFLKVGRRHEVAVSRLNLAACLDRDLSDPRVVLGSCFPSPRRLVDVEELIKGGKPGPELWQAAGEMAAGHFTYVCGWRSSATYKVPAITRITARALQRAWAGLEARS
ncbi:MAG: FAD binding domain-containing protein [Desulfarculaceae bacterium]|nr:FAD binding domain-containing protein [Desulfarculaceae bacterium]MCF8047561.1 FAD binding domain-containing protein [Desulfarculaceae bacterium]MCF8063852.1 FAD binding domain-containing protein [Desulfarculaceae bacterium]MCF8098944.1 FAD binding domain-containing protein [Desulfarculaceae bacterium]MCF8122589.1 FAD binding domain-containing protein [Desulfarculaceae bacterium]